MPMRIFTRTCVTGLGSQMPSAIKEAAKHAISVDVVARHLAQRLAGCPSARHPFPPGRARHPRQRVRPTIGRLEESKPR